MLGVAVVPVEQGAGDQEADEGSCRAIQHALSLTALWLTAYWTEFSVSWDDDIPKDCTLVDIHA